MKYLDIYITLIDEKPHENILIYDISYKTLIGAKPLHIRFNKIDGYNIVWLCNMMLFTKEWDIL